MATTNDTTGEKYNLDDETISQVGLQLTGNAVVKENAPQTRVFDYPGMKDVFVMETDLYGGPMPEGSCYLAFYGQHGLLGRAITIEKLKAATTSDIEKFIEENKQG